MKVTKRILAILLTILMLVGTCSVATSAAGDLQAAINAAAANGTVTMTGDTTESVTITKDLTLDLGGYELKSVPGSPAITVVGANVTITNGHVVSQFADVKSLTMLETVVNESPAAINVKGGSVSVEGVRAVGSMTRIPTTSQYHFPTGSAIALTDGATATIKQSSLVGRYGVNNKVTNETAGGSVEIEDAIMMGFLRAVKDSSKKIIPGDTEEVNAGDRIEGFLNSGIQLEERERRVLKEIFSEKVMIYTKSVQDEATSTFSECTGKVTVKAHEDVSNIWANNTSTDCSYKYVPEYVVLADGTLVKMTGKDDAYTAEIDADQAKDIQVKYRLTFDLQPDIQGLTSNFNMYLEDLYQKVIKTANEVYDYALEKYTNYTVLVGNIANKLDSMGNEEIGGKAVKDIPEYQRLRRAVYDLGGATIWEATHEGYTFGDRQMSAIYGEGTTMPADGIVGTIDRVTVLKKELESFMPFSDQSKWADLGFWAFENIDTVLGIIDEALTRIEALQNILDGDLESQLVASAGLQDKRATLDKVQKITSDVKTAVYKILDNSSVQVLMQKANNNKDELKPYINKFISIYNNHEVYFTPDKFLDGTFAKAYAVYGGAKETDPIKHTPGDTVKENDVQPSCTEKGSYDEVVYCTVCGAEISRKTVDVDAAGHDYVATQIDATCTTEGKTEFKCSVCGDVYYRGYESAKGHNYEVTWAWADDYSSATATFICANCGDKQILTVFSIDMTIKTDATCTDNAIVTYTASVTINGTTYADTTAEVTLEGSKKGHTESAPVKENEVALTCTVNGSYDDVVYCSECGVELSRKTVTAEATGHAYGAPVWAWADDYSSATATFTCAVCGDVQTPDVAISVNPISEQSCTESEVVTYTAKVTFEEKDYTNTTDKVTLASATGHSYGEPTWAWEDDFTSATATFVCVNGDCGDTQVLTVSSIDMTVVTEANCLDNEVVTYTASVTINGTNYENTTEAVTLEGTAKGHTEGAAVKENEVAPTCTVEGSYDEVVYCSECGIELSRTTVTVAATGHTYGAPVWEWADDYSSATATFTCVEGDDTQIVTASRIVLTINSPATCTEDEVVTYTAIAVFEGVEYTDDSEQITLQDTALGHVYNINFENPVPADEQDTHMIIPEGDGYNERHVFLCTRCKDEKSAITYVWNNGQFTSQGTHNFNNSTWVNDPTADPDKYPLGACKAECSNPDCAECARLVAETGERYVQIEEHFLLDSAWRYVSGSATCYFNGYETNKCLRCETVVKREKEDVSMRPAHHFVFVSNDEETHTKKCTVCEEKGQIVDGVEGVENSVTILPHRFTEWEYQNDHTFFKNGHQEHECKDCGFKKTEEVPNTSGLKRLISWIFGTSVFGTWIYTGISYFLAKVFGVPDSELSKPPKWFEDFLRFLKVIE